MPLMRRRSRTSCGSGGRSATVRTASAAHLGHRRSTVYGVLRCHGCSRRPALDRSTGVLVRSVRDRPGELVHRDVKQLARIPDGGGHRLLGREIRGPVPPGRRPVLRRPPHPIERVRTDQAFAYTQAHAFREAMASLGARHRTTRPYRPQTNGKAERFIRTLREEWASARLDRTNAERLAALPGWLAFYNHRSPHTAPGARPPITAVNNVRGNYT